MTAHTCHAAGCSRVVPPKLLMCRRHWRMVPRKLQGAVWATYRPGQETDKRPSRGYLDAAQAAIAAVAAVEAERQVRGIVKAVERGEGPSYELPLEGRHAG